MRSMLKKIFRMQNALGSQYDVKQVNALKDEDRYDMKQLDFREHH